jgi:hypothetical protein
MAAVAMETAKMLKLTKLIKSKTENFGRIGSYLRYIGYYYAFCNISSYDILAYITKN